MLLPATGHRRRARDCDSSRPVADYAGGHEDNDLAEAPEQRQADGQSPLHHQRDCDHEVQDEQQSRARSVVAGGRYAGIPYEALRISTRRDEIPLCLACMTDAVPEETEIDNPARIVEAFLCALHDEDWGTAAGALDENVIYDNVGYPTINGRPGVMKFWHCIFGRPSAGFEARIHRIAVDGASVLTERTDVMVFGAFDCKSGCVVCLRCKTARSRSGATILTCWTCSRQRYAGSLGSPCRRSSGRCERGQCRTSAARLTIA